jgi:hypothetical protein
MLFPSLLLMTGWWDKEGPPGEHLSTKYRPDSWSLPEEPVRDWLLHGFTAWAPSWDFSFSRITRNDRDKWPEYFAAQIGHGDEADSVPVFLPKSTIERFPQPLADDFVELFGKGYALPVRITGMFGNIEYVNKIIEKAVGERDSTIQENDKSLLAKYGSVLNYFLWLDPSDARHRIEILDHRFDTNRIYSGYLWKCFARLNDSRLRYRPTRFDIRDTFFVWEHTNFANIDAVKFNLQMLKAKEEFIRTHLKNKGYKCIPLQKSSLPVPGKVTMNSADFYDLIEKPLGYNTGRI